MKYTRTVTIDFGNGARPVIYRQYAEPIGSQPAGTWFDAVTGKRIEIGTPLSDLLDRLVRMH